MKDFVITYAFATLLQLLKESSLHVTWKPALLKVFRTMLWIFAADPDFQKAIADAQTKAAGV